MSKSQPKPQRQVRFNPLPEVLAAEEPARAVVAAGPVADTAAVREPVSDREQEPVPGQPAGLASLSAKGRIIRKTHGPKAGKGRFGYRSW